MPKKYGEKGDFPAAEGHPISDTKDGKRDALAGVNSKEHAFSQQVAANFALLTSTVSGHVLHENV
jgi:hypothetical protein